MTRLVVQLPTDRVLRLGKRVVSLKGFGARAHDLVAVLYMCCFCSELFQVEFYPQVLIDRDIKSKTKVSLV